MIQLSLFTLLPSVFSTIFTSLLIALLLSIGISIFSFKIKNNRPAFSFGILMFIISLWIVVKIISLFVFSIDTREILHKINILLVVLIGPFIFLVAIYHSQFPRWFKTKHEIFIFFIPAIVYLLVCISPFHNFLYYDFKILVNQGIPMHVLKFKAAYQLLNLHNYFLLISTFFILIRSLFKRNIFFRRQMLLFIIGLLIPVLYDALYLLGYSPIKDYNLAPVIVSIGNIFIAWSLFGYRFFNAIPVARNKIIDNMPDIIIIARHGDFVIDINKSGENLFECKKDDIIGISFFEIFKSHPDLLEVIVSKNTSSEIRINKNDKELYFSASLSYIENIEKDGNIYIIILHEITERIEAEIEIKRFSTAIEQAPVTVVITDVNGNIEYVNPAFTQITGYLPEEAYGANPRVLKGNTPPETFIDLWNTISKGDTWKGEFINRKKSGDYYYEEATISPIKNDRGEIINYIAVKNDISSRKIAEAKLKLSEENLKAAQSIGNVGHWEYNDNNGELFWSEQMYSIYEVSPLDFKPTFANVVAFFHPEDRQKVEEEYRSSVINKNKFEIQHRIITGKGKIKYIIERSSTNYEENGIALKTIGSVSDITNLKMIEIELENKRALLRSLIDSIPDLIFVKDLKGVYLLGNKAFNHFFGLESSKILGKTDFEIVNKSEVEQFLEVDNFVIGHEKTYISEDYVEYPDGEKVWLETRKTPFYGADGKITGLIGVSRNITQRKAHEDALRESEANMLSLVENTIDNIWAIDTSYKIIFVNSQFKNAFKTSYGIDLNIGTDIIDALPEPLRPNWIEKYEKSFNNQRFTFEDHFQFGEIQLYFEIAMNPIVSGTEVIGVSVFSRNISERKNAEIILKQKKDEIATQNVELLQLNEELQLTNSALHFSKEQAEEGEELFKQLMAHSPVYIFIKDLNLRFVRMSSNYETFLNQPVYKIIGKTNEEIWPAETACIITDDETRALISTEPIQVEFEVDNRYYTAIKFPITFEGKNKYLASYMIDITDRKLAENQIQYKNQQLIDLNATKDKFFSIIAHDLRSPFNAILGFSEHLANNLESCSDDEVKLFAGNINISATQTYKLLENLLEWSRIQRGLVKPDIQKHNLAKLADEMIALTINNAKSKNISLHHTITPEAFVLCDIEMTKTVMRNLISNAIKFTKNGGKIIVDAAKKEEKYEICIEDNGVGISEEKLPYVFSIEKNTTTKGTENESGTGLGLLLCKELVLLQGGEIRIESKEGKGSRFFFTLNQFVY